MKERKRGNKYDGGDGKFVDKEIDNEWTLVSEWRDYFLIHNNLENGYCRLDRAKERGICASFTPLPFGGSSKQVLAECIPQTPIHGLSTPHAQNIK